jgi:hypothetical protein
MSGFLRKWGLLKQTHKDKVRQIIAGLYAEIGRGVLKDQRNSLEEGRFLRGGFAL